MMANPPRQWRGVPIGEAVVLDQGTTAYTVGTTAETILDADPERIALALSASGSGNIWVTTNRKPATNEGIYLKAGDRPVMISDDNMPGFAGRALYAVADAAGSTLTVAHVRIV